MLRCLLRCLLRCAALQDTVRIDMRMFAEHMSPDLREEWLASDSEDSEGSGEGSEASDDSAGEEGASSGSDAAEGGDAEEEEEGTSDGEYAAVAAVAGGASGRARSLCRLPAVCSARSSMRAAPATCLLLLRCEAGRAAALRLTQACFCAAGSLRRARQPSRRAARVRKRPWSPEPSPTRKSLPAKRQRGQQQQQRGGAAAAAAAGGQRGAAPPAQPARRPPSARRASAVKKQQAAAKLAGPDRGQRLQQRQQRAGTFLSPRAERLLLRERRQAKQVAAVAQGLTPAPPMGVGTVAGEGRQQAAPAAAPALLPAAAAAAEHAERESGGSLRSGGDSVQHAPAVAAAGPSEGEAAGAKMATRSGGSKSRGGGGGTAPAAPALAPAPGGGGRRLLGMVTGVLPQLRRMQGGGPAK